MRRFRRDAKSSWRPERWPKQECRRDRSFENGIVELDSEIFRLVALTAFPFDPQFTHGVALHLATLHHLPLPEPNARQSVDSNDCCLVQGILCEEFIWREF